jgi:hypothetical protein
MTTVKIREKVHTIIDNADERILKVVYAMLKEYEKVETITSLLTETQQAEVNHRWDNHKNGKSKSYTLDETTNYVKAHLKK